MEETERVSVYRIVRFDGTKIAEWWGVADLLGAIYQLGGKLVLEYEMPA